eukprot:973215-Karenia_brevis.AAC.1
MIADGDDGQDKPDMPNFIDAAPPEVPNVYTDGGLTHPDMPIIGLATAGIWWPDRTSSASELEQEFGRVQKTPKGLEIMTRIAGLGLSSARSELLGLIMGSLSPSPAHIALDNASVVKK